MKTLRPVRSAPARRASRTTPSRGDGPPTFARADLGDVDIDRPKPIDHYIDYFGNGVPCRTVATTDPRGGSSPNPGGSRPGRAASAAWSPELLEALLATRRDR